MRHPSTEIKEAMVTKLCSPGGPSIYQLGKESGISQGKNGLHRSDLELWKQEALAGFSNKRGRPRKDPELASAQDEVKRMKRDLRRKEKALAEQTALVILQKKALKLWGGTRRTSKRR